MTFEDREGGVWIKAECPRLVPKSTRLVASCSSRAAEVIERGKDITEIGTVARCAETNRWTYKPEFG
jgi:hypothetical protein